MPGQFKLYIPDASEDTKEPPFNGKAEECKPPFISEKHLWSKSDTRSAKGTHIKQYRALLDRDGNMDLSKLNAKQRQDFPFANIVRSTHQHCQDCRAKYLQTCKKVGPLFKIRTKNDHFEFEDLDRATEDFINDTDNSDEKQHIVRIDALDNCILDRFFQNSRCYKDQKHQKLLKDLKIIHDPEHNEFVTKLCEVTDKLRHNLELISGNTQVKNPTENPTESPVEKICAVHKDQNAVLRHFDRNKTFAYSFVQQQQQQPKGVTITKTKAPMPQLSRSSRREKRSRTYNKGRKAKTSRKSQRMRNKRYK